MKHPRSACGASPSRGRFQRPGKAGSAVSLALGRAGVVRPGPWLWIASALLLAGCAAPAPTPQRAVDLQAHRGGRALAPENTLSAFTHAIAIGVTTLELDIGLTADGVVVISHDTSLNPDHTRDASGAWLAPNTGAAIRSLTLAQLQTYDVGRLNPTSNYGKQFALQQPRDGERIPTLDALLALAARGIEHLIAAQAEILGK